jgi:hypothetical protein
VKKKKPPVEGWCILELGTKKEILTGLRQLVVFRQCSLAVYGGHTFPSSKARSPSGVGRKVHRKETPPEMAAGSAAPR